VVISTRDSMTRLVTRLNQPFALRRSRCKRSRSYENRQRNRQAIRRRLKSRFFFSGKSDAREIIASHGIDKPLLSGY
jgi:hypothetical protein